jgi:membrane-associated phospholipid phosphatase
VSEEVIESELRANNVRTVRRLCAIAYFTVLGLLLVIDGIPTGRLLLSAITITGLGISCIGQGWRRFVRVFADWLPFTAALLVYDMSRSFATTVDLPLHEKDIADAENRLFGGTNPTVWLQHHFYVPGSVQWYDGLATLIYMSHFVATPILAAVLWMRNRRLWVGYISRVVALSFAGLVTYVLFPEAPPWYAARDHYLPPVSRLSARGLEWMHLGNVQHLLADAQEDGANPIAAMPSLHTAFAVLIAIFVAGRIASRWRYLAYAYPVAMGLVLVYTGEHYVLDILVGVGYALAVHALITRWERSRKITHEQILEDTWAVP